MPMYYVQSVKKVELCTILCTILIQFWLIRLEIVVYDISGSVAQLVRAVDS